MASVPNYTYDQNFPHITAGNAWSVLIAKGNVYVGGSFSVMGGVSRINLAAFNAITRALQPFSPVIGGAPIADMLFLNDVLYVAALGAIVTAAGPVRQGVAAFDLNGNLLPWDPSLNGPAYALATDGTSIFIGGSFTTVGGNPYDRIVKVDAAVGTPDGGFAASANGQVSDLFWDAPSSSLYAVGQFTTANATARNFAARFDAAGALLPWDPNLSAAGNAVLIANGLSYVGGFFTTVNGGTTRNGVAVLDPATGVADPQDFGMTTASSVFSLGYNPVNGMLYVGGGIGTVQGEEPEGMFVVDPATGALQLPLTSFNSPALYFAFSSTWVVIAGFFNQFLGDFLTNGSFFAFNTGSVERSAYSAPVGFNQAQESMANDGTNIYVAGPGSTVATGANGSFARNGLTRFDPSGNVDAAFAPDFGATGIVNKVIVSGGLIYAAGRFTSVNGTPRDGFAVLDMAGALQPMDLGLSMSPPYAIGVDVFDMRIDATHIYLAGTFLWVNGSGVNSQASVARFDRATGVWDATWTPAVLPVFNTGWVYSIELDGTYAYIGGDFATVGGQPRLNLARIPLAGAGAPDPGWVFDTNQPVAPRGLSIDQSTGDLYAAGSFVTVNATPTGGVAKITAAGSLDLGFAANMTSYSVGQASSVNRIGADTFMTAQGLTYGTPTNGSQWLGNIFSVDASGALSWFTPSTNGFASDVMSFGGRTYFLGGFTHLYQSLAPGGLAAFYAPAVPETTLPRPPKIRFLNRRPQDGRPALTMLRWDPVVRDVSNNPTVSLAYRVYRTASKNLEDPVLIAEISTRDLKDDIDTLFVEEIDGYYRYCVSAVNSAGEGGKSCANFAPTQQLERLG